MWSREARAAGAYPPTGHHGDDLTDLAETQTTTFMTSMLCVTIMETCMEGITQVLAYRILETSVLAIKIALYCLLDRWNWFHSPFFTLNSILQELHWWAVVLLWWQWGSAYSWWRCLSADCIHSILSKEDNYSLLVGKQLCCRWLLFLVEFWVDTVCRLICLDLEGLWRCWHVNQVTLFFQPSEPASY